MDSQIKYLTRAEIQVELWNGCIDEATNGLVYGYSYYLDLMVSNWDALILNNYEAVMPLPWRKKWGFYYLYQPFLTPQLGLFGKVIDEELLSLFLSSIPKKFNYLDFTLNHQNFLMLSKPPFRERSNYVLPLQKPYDQLYNGYNNNIKRNCKKAVKKGCTISNDVSVDSIIALTKLEATSTPGSDFKNFEKVYQFLKEHHAAKTYAVLSANDELLASCVFLFSHHRAYYILVGNHPKGKLCGASHALIDGFIKDHAGQDLVLDFEGSDLSNVAFFYKSFGAVEEKYASLKINRLPWWVRWLKP